MRRLLLVLTAATIRVSAAAADPVGDKLIACAPATFDTAVQCLHDDLPPRTRAALLKPDGAIRAHLGLGTFLRNEWGLWKGGPLMASLLEIGFRHPDDMSGAILNAYVARENGKDFDVRKAAAGSTNYWRDVAAREQSIK